MAKVNCEICNKEVGALGKVKLVDGKVICKDCLKKTCLFFEPDENTLEDFNANLKQNEDGSKLYDAYFKKNKKAVKLCDDIVLYDAVTQLVCICSSRGGLFSRKRFYNVFRLADLDKYEAANRFHRTTDGSNSQTPCVYLSFRTKTPGVANFMIASEAAKTKKLIRTFDEAISGKTRGALGFAGSIKTTIKKSQDQAMSAANMASSMASAIKAMQSGDEAAAMSAGEQFTAQNEELFYAGRENLIETADAAIKSVIG